MTQQDQRKTPTENPDHQVWCICRKEENGRMILCDNETCKTGWLHFTCVGTSRKPHGKWYCAECKLITRNVVIALYVLLECLKWISMLFKLSNMAYPYIIDCPSLVSKTEAI